MCSQPDNFVSVRCSGLEKFCLLFHLLLLKYTAVLALRIVVARSKIRQKKEKHCWNYTVIKFSSSPPQKQGQQYLESFLDRGEFIFPRGSFNTKQKDSEFAYSNTVSFLLCQATYQQEFDFIFLEKIELSAEVDCLWWVEQVVTSDSFQASILLELYEHQ